MLSFAYKYNVTTVFTIARVVQYHGKNSRVIPKNKRICVLDALIENGI